MKPIEPGCVCITVNCRQDAVGRMVLAIEPIAFADIQCKEALKFGRDGFWWIRPLAGVIPANFSESRSSLTAEAIVCHETQLRRLDDDPDAAEPRVTEREIEHA